MSYGYGMMPGMGQASEPSNVTLDQYAAMLQQQFAGQGGAAPSAPASNDWQGFYVPRGKSQGGDLMPKNGQMALGSMSAPDIPIDKDGNQARGYWVAQGNANMANAGDYSAGNIPQQYRWVAEQAPAAPVMMPQEEAPKKKEEAPSDGRTIYNDWDKYIDEARKAVEGINRMPFTYSDYGNVSTNRNEAMNQFYPGAWQKNGLQPFIGPNGQNISNDVGLGIYEALKKGTASTSDTQDWPTLVKTLLQSNTTSPAMIQTLLDMAKPKKLDTSFQSSGLMGMMGG